METSIRWNGGFAAWLRAAAGDSNSNGVGSTYHSSVADKSAYHSSARQRRAQNTGWPLHDQLTPDLTSEWRVIGDLGRKVPTLKASGHDPRFECQTTQDQSVSFARLHLVIS